VASYSSARELFDEIVRRARSGRRLIDDHPFIDALIRLDAIRAGTLSIWAENEEEGDADYRVLFTVTTVGSVGDHLVFPPQLDLTDQQPEEAWEALGVIEKARIEKACSPVEKPMNNKLFPRVCPDGSFCVDIIIELTHGKSGDLAPRVADWLRNDWHPNNRIWIRSWTSGKGVREERLLYDADFTAPAKALPHEDSKISIRLVGKGESKFWRDWLVSKLLPDLKKQFSEIGEGLSARNCPHD